MTNYNPSISSIYELESLIQNLTGLVSNIETSFRIPIPTSDGIELILTKDIVRVEAERSYCFIYLNTGSKMLCSKPLKELEARLKCNNFFRIHSAHLINLDYVSRYVKSDGGFVLLTNGENIPLSRRRKKDFIDRVMYSTI